MALTVEVKNAEGKKVGSVDLPSEIFDAQTNIPLIHQVVTAQLAAARQGTQKAKNRGETSSDVVLYYRCSKHYFHSLGVLYILL